MLDTLKGYIRQFLFWISQYLPGGSQGIIEFLHKLIGYFSGKK